MNRPRYTLSQEGMNTLMGELAKVAQGNIDDSVAGLLSSAITTNFVKTMTKVKGMEDVIERNEQLSKTYKGLLSLYGFDTMYDMYLYARSCDLYPDELLKSERIAVTKTVTRNGKPLDVTVWASVSKGEAAKPKAEEPLVRHARELKGKAIGVQDTSDPAKVAKIKAAASKLPKGSKPFNDKSHHYLTLSSGSKVSAVIGYSEDDTHITMDFYRTDGVTAGVATRGFAELIRLANQKRKGVKMEDNPSARAVFAMAGLRQEDSQWIADYKDLKEVYGEKANEDE